MNSSENQNLTDEQLAKLIEEGVALDENTVPDDLAGAKPEDQEKINNAFAELKRKNKALALALKSKPAKESASEGNNQPVNQNGVQPPPNAGAGNVSAIMGQLTMQAMNNLGLNVATAQSPEAKELIRMEVQRLYSDSVAQVQRANAVKEQAPRIINEALSNYPMLGEEGVDAVKRRLAKYDILTQIDPEVIRQTVTSYFGELMLAGASTSGDDGASAGANQQQPVRRDAASVSAASSVKNGRPGVKPASNGGQASLKPATPEEAKMMSDLGMTDVKLFREAQARKHIYAGK